MNSTQAQTGLKLNIHFHQTKSGKISVEVVTPLITSLITVIPDPHSSTANHWSVLSCANKRFSCCQVVCETKNQMNHHVFTSWSDRPSGLLIYPQPRCYSVLRVHYWSKQEAGIQRKEQGAESWDRCRMKFRDKQWRQEKTCLLLEPKRFVSLRLICKICI